MNAVEPSAPDGARVASAVDVSTADADALPVREEFTLDSPEHLAPEADEPPEDGEEPRYEVPDEVAADAAPEPPVDRSGIARAMAERVRRALSGDEEARKALSSHERRIVRAVEQAQNTGTSASRAVETPEEAHWYRRHAELVQLAMEDEYTFGQQLRQNPRAAAEWASIVEYKQNELGLPPTATDADVRARVAAIRAQRAAADAQQIRAGLDPDALYDSFLDAPEWNHLTAEEQASLAPEAFEGDDAKRARAMAVQFGRLAERASTRAARAPIEAKVRAVNGTADHARAAARTSPPVVGARPKPATLSADELTQKWIDAHETGRMTPALDAAYQAMQRTKRGSSWSFLG